MKQMIFVTVGTTSFPFDRLLKAVDETIKGKEELIVQRGVSKYKFKYPNVKVFTELPFDEMISNIKRARIIIAAGGPATIFLALKYGKNIPLVMPRSKEFGEHVDDHEVLFCQSLAKRGQVKTIMPNADVVIIMSSYFRFPEKNILNAKKTQTDSLVKKLVKYTENI